MRVVICPGIHESKLTEGFLGGLFADPAGEHPDFSQLLRIFPAPNAAAYSALDILQFLCSQESPRQSLIFVSFSAGVVGAIGAAWGWQALGGEVKAFFALDGWGVPLVGNFPLHRLSHDYFTHWSSALLGSGSANFYADPPVEHLSLWQSPQTVKGWHLEHQGGKEVKRPATATEFLRNWLKHYGVNSID